jgi:hypothetical protein
MAIARKCPNEKMKRLILDLGCVNKEKKINSGVNVDKNVDLSKYDKIH